jgi:hypothetical protein
LVSLIICTGGAYLRFFERPAFQRRFKSPDRRVGRPLSRSLTEHIFIFPTGFARIVAG